MLSVNIQCLPYSVRVIKVKNILYFSEVDEQTTSDEM